MLETDHHDPRETAAKPGAVLQLHELDLRFGGVTLWSLEHSSLKWRTSDPVSRRVATANMSWNI